MIFVGIDWAEAHHDVCVVDTDGRVLSKARIAEGVAGVAALHALIGEHTGDDDEPDRVVVGIETDRGLLVAALVAAGYQVMAVNPLAVSRYRDRHSVSGAKSDPGDARVLADLVRIDRHVHRPIAGDSDLAEAVKLLARAHQSAVWFRQRQVNQLRSALREYYPAALAAFGADLDHPDALAVLALAPTPELGRRLSTAKIRSALARAGRQRKPRQPRRGDPRRAALRPAPTVGGRRHRPRHRLRHHHRLSGPPDHRRDRADRHAIDWWAFNAITRSPGARACYDRHRANSDTHRQALPAVGNKLVGILHGCLRHHQPYQQHLAWPQPLQTAA